MAASDVGAATFSVAQGMTALLSMLPKLTDVRKAHADDPEFAADLRVAELGGTVVAVGIGGICSYLTGSRVPVVSALFIVLTLIVLYEIVLRRDPEGY